MLSSTAVSDIVNLSARVQKNFTSVIDVNVRVCMQIALALEKTNFRFLYKLHEVCCICTCCQGPSAHQHLVLWGPYL